ncbi:putative transcription factor bZIP family [Helianthus annuus]|nr:putative transcription factor bZIP family [Helianthus annuus]
MKLWMVRATIVVLLWTCLVHLMALGESWGPRVLKGWPSHDSVISGAALDVKLLLVVPVRELPPKSEFFDLTLIIIEAKREASITCLQMVILHTFSLVLRPCLKIYHKLIIAANARNNNSGPNVQMPVPRNPVVSMPATNLNMGMDLWNPSAGSGSMKKQPNHSGFSQPGVPLPIMADQWGQDERELKRQKRKQSNRESVRRSRLRKQVMYTCRCRVKQLLKLILTI